MFSGVVPQPCIKKRDPHQTEFAQAVREVMTTLWPFLEQNPRYRQMSLLERLVEPERVIQFAWYGWTTETRYK
ncbi:NADP-specific glutamate dehydrogenase [Salmonella bongori]|nr:NADP-specific glutamate dehydrogenase [Salmonella bongori]